MAEQVGSELISILAGILMVLQVVGENESEIMMMISQLPEETAKV